MVALNDIFEKVTDNWVSRVILDEVVVMPLCRSEDDAQYIYSISNETGTRIWQLLDSKHSVKDIQEILKSEFKGEEEKIEKEVLDFLEDILGVGLISKSGEKKISDLKVSISSKKKPYKSPEIVKVRMQPEQALLACCINVAQAKLGEPNINYCLDRDAVACDVQGCTLTAELDPNSKNSVT